MADTIRVPIFPLIINSGNGSPVSGELSIDLTNNDIVLTNLSGKNISLYEQFKKKILDSIPADNNTTYKLSEKDGKIILTGNDNTTTSVNKTVVSSATNVTDTGTALSATHANPNISGSLAAQIASKQATITGAASSITSSNLTAAHALISNSSGKVAISSVTATELGYLVGVTSEIQDQLDNKVESDGSVTGLLRDGSIDYYMTVKGTGDIKIITENNVASSSAAGAVKIGNNITNSSGTISITKANVVAALGYTPPTAQRSVSSATNVTDPNIALSATHANPSVDGSLAAQIAAKQATITGAASSITSDNLYGSRVLISDSSGKVAASTITTAELGNINGLSGNIMTLLAGKLGTGATAADSNKWGGYNLSIVDEKPNSDAIDEKTIYLIKE